MLATPVADGDREATGNKRVWTFRPASPGEPLVPLLSVAQSAVLESFRAAGILPLDLPQLPSDTLEERLAVMKQAGRLCAQADQ